MASKPRDLVVRFLADVRGFVQGTSDMEDALRDTADAQDRLAREGDQAADKLAASYRRAADKMDRDLRGTRTTVKEGFADTGKEAGAEFAQNLGQSLSSGDTSRVVQDSVGGLIGSLAFAGPVGAAVAAAGTIALSFWNAWEEKTKQQREAVLAVVGDVYQGLLDQGADFVREYNSTTLRDFLNPATSNELARRAREASQRLGTDLANALAGGPESVAQAAREAQEELDTLYKGRLPATMTSAQRQRVADLRAEIDYLTTITTGWNDAQEAAEDYYTATLKLPRAVRDTLRPGGRDAGQVPSPFTSGRR